MENIIDILKKVGAMLPDDHFVGTSGAHFDTYINKDRLFVHPEDTGAICKLFAERHKDLDIDAVAGPAMGGIILAQWVAYHLSKLRGKEVLAVYAEKKDGDHKFTRGYDKDVAGKNVLVVEDLTTTGGSLKKVVDLVKEAGGNVIGASVMVNKNSDVTSDTFGVPFTPLATYEVKTYSPEECELCKNNTPINTTIGHGKKFVESQSV